MDGQKSTISTLLNFDRVEAIYEHVKAICIDHGASPESFKALDEKNAEIRAKILSDVAGGFINKTKEDGRHHEDLLPQKITRSAASNTLPGKSDK